MTARIFSLCLLNHIHSPSQCFEPSILTARFGGTVFFVWFFIVVNGSLAFIIDQLCLRALAILSAVPLYYILHHQLGNVKRIKIKNPTKTVVLMGSFFYVGYSTRLWRNYFLSLFIGTQLLRGRIPDRDLSLVEDTIITGLRHFGDAIPFVSHLRFRERKQTLSTPMRSAHGNCPISISRKLSYRQLSLAGKTHLPQEGLTTRIFSLCLSNFSVRVSVLNLPY